MSTASHWSHSLQLTAEPASAALAREFVRSELLNAGLPHLVDDLRLVVSELVTNAVSHARSPSTVVLERSGQSVTLTVRDGSPSLPLLPSLAEADSMAGGGRGLGIVDVLSCDWGVTSRLGESKAVWAAFAAADGVASVPAVR
jgi:anti-sigma regulatory factor (Ser/Thr protein kinase)